MKHIHPKSYAGCVLQIAVCRMLHRGLDLFEPLELCVRFACGLFDGLVRELPCEGYDGRSPSSGQFEPAILSMRFKQRSSVSHPHRVFARHTQ